MAGTHSAIASTLRKLAATASNQAAKSSVSGCPYAFLTVGANPQRSTAIQDEATRLLMHGYEVIESFHRTSAHFAAFQVSLRQASLSMTAAIEDLGRFPVYELDKNFGPMSLARRLMTMRMTVSSVRLFIDAAAEEIGDRTATDEEQSVLRELIGKQLRFAHNLLMGASMQRPDWPGDESSDT